MALPDTTQPAAEPAPTPAENAPATSEPSTSLVVSEPAVAPAASEPAAAPGEILGYCVKCKTSRTMTQVEIVTTKNNRRAAKGKCPVCGTKMNKFLPK